MSLTTVNDPDWKNAAGRLKLFELYKQVSLIRDSGKAINRLYVHLDRISDTNGEGNLKGNFFEANVSSYNQSTAVEGWDEL